MDEITEENDIGNMIYVVRGVEVMLDSDLAKLYHVETKRINEAVKNNPDKFPMRYCFTLVDEELKFLRSKFSALEIRGQGKYSKYSPRVFTEQGIYMLATILKSKAATEVSIRIMDTFVKMRHYINFNKYTLPYKFLLLENKVDENSRRIDQLFDKFNPKDVIKSCIIYKGELYDAYSIFIDILSEAKKEIIIIDNYAGKELLDIIKNFKNNIIVLSKNIDEILKKKYKEQYKNVSFIQDDSYHDRFVVIDRKRLYVSGASFKDMGKGCFTLFELTDDLIKEIFINELIKKIEI